ncbi:MAG: N-glycosylase/DNA lyase [Candidatus Odinarchaeia archaeon]
MWLQINQLNKLIEKIEKLKKSIVKKQVEKRISEFKLFKSEINENHLFNELCYCLLTANFNAERTIKIQNQIGDGFLNLTEVELVNRLKELGYRFPNTRAKYICQSRCLKKEIKEVIKEVNKSWEIREWLVKNIKGLGYKEASHFLRNIGFNDIAIIDFHIINLLEEYDLVKKQKR